MSTLRLRISRLLRGTLSTWDNSARASAEGIISLSKAVASSARGLNVTPREMDFRCEPTESGEAGFDTGAATLGEPPAGTTLAVLSEVLGAISSAAVVVLMVPAVAEVLVALRVLVFV